MEFSPDGQRLAVGDDDGAIRIFDLTTGETNRTIKAHQQLISALAWSPTASILASGSAYAGGPVRLWDLNTGEPVGELEGHTGWICQLIFSADGHLLYSASADQTIRIWDVETKELLVTLRGSTDEVYSLALSPDGKTLASGSKDGVVAFWSASPAERRHLVRHCLDISGWYSFAPDGRSFAAPVKGIVRLYEMPGFNLIGELPELGTNVWCVTHSLDGTLIVSGSEDGWLRVWARADRRLVREIPVYQGEEISPFLFLPDGRLVSEGYPRGELIFWDTRTWQRLASFAAPGGHSYRVSPDGRVALTLDSARQLTWWDTVNGKLLATRSAHRLPCWGYAFSPDAKVVASVSEDNSVALWEAATFKFMAAFRAHRNGAFGVAFSPDGRRLAHGGQRDRFNKAVGFGHSPRIAHLFRASRRPGPCGGFFSRWQLAGRLGLVGESLPLPCPVVGGNRRGGGTGSPRLNPNRHRVALTYPPEFVSTPGPRPHRRERVCGHCRAPMKELLHE
jgi:WD40 repeat protein